MIDETPRMDGPEEPRQNAERVGFCQDCGKPLTRETVRTVGSGVFCEPCLEVRLGSASNQRPGGPIPQTGPAGAYPGGMPAGGSGSIPGAVPRAAGEPSPALAALIGVVPGAGAVYNGQYGKGAAHLVVFAVLMLLAKDVNDIFSLFIMAWIVYMMIDAHHTARARRDGMPLPDPFGFNDIGERMGFGRNWGVATPVKTPPPAPPIWPTPSASAPYTPPAAPPYPSPATPYSPTTPPGGVPVTSGPDWVGYVPPVAFGAGAVPPPYTASSQDSAAETLAANIRAQAMHDAGYHASSYRETYTGAGPANANAIPPVSTRRFPVGAIWLIALGGLFLVSNWVPFWRMNGSATVAVLMAGLATWVIVRRLGFAGGIHYSGHIVCALRAPVLLLTLAVIFGLQAANIATFAEAWPLLLVTMGVVLLLERTVGSGPMYIPPPGAASMGAAGTGFVPPPGSGYGAEGDPGRGDFGKGGL